MIAVVFVKRSVRLPGKHSILIDGKRLLDRVVETIVKVKEFDEVIVFSKDLSVSGKGIRIIKDNTEGTIVDSLIWAIQHLGDIFAFAGDMPCISADLISLMIRRKSSVALIPIHSDGGVEPLHAIYLKKSLDDGLNSNTLRTLKSFAKMIPHEYFPIPASYEHTFFNLNTPEDLKFFRSNGCQAKGEGQKKALH